MRTSIAAKPYSLVKQPISFPRRVFCARVLLCRFTHPSEGVAERRESYGCLRGTRWACTLRGRPGAGEATCVLRRKLDSRRSIAASCRAGHATTLYGLV